MNEKKKKYVVNFLTALSSDHLQGGDGMIHPKTIPYNQTRDHSTGGSHHSSDRGSNSTSGEAMSWALTDVWWLFDESSQKSLFTVGFFF